ncbi:GNAT family N-acetyltransferase [Micromonospora sp. WMMD961]|uniref:GNAT family N-acetyltransferase n=1 Tax=unclassified Micromonospora TaxID=2617518 RepID=UPI0024175421|nr:MULTISPECIES: GNAT family N-acetyltransferase [unclassified Micromonospora]MDG4783312.1 GNAT family N-acetyltransferase [Micromonospora sp. WMMD961]WFE52269.1 GNAT family N-acetyltransferase [Micromonospora sp. WMMD1155]WFF00970.1 GNAT family N-acetyltransferase [Micromonospora sp. WMMD964]
MLIESRPATDPEIAALVVAQQRELREADGGLDGQVFVPHDDVRYLAVVVNGRAVACGGLQALDAETGEVKRMYVRPAYRGRGIARQLLAALEECAFRQGHSVVCLETGTYLPAAIGLYTSCGYDPIPVYGEYVGNPYSVCFAKRLPVAA